MIGKIKDVFDGSTAVRSRSDGKVRVLIVDDHEVQRVGTRQVLETTDDIVVVGEADGGNSALALAGEIHPDVALVDIRLPDRNGIDVARELAVHHRGTRVVLLSAYDDDALVRGAQEAGVAGYLLKTLPRTDLIAAVRAAGSGKVVLDPAVSARWEHVRTCENVAHSAQLTLRERQIVALVSEGLANKAIAAHLAVSVRTVEGHMNHVFAKLGLETRTELVRFALTNGLSLAENRGPTGADGTGTAGGDPADGAFSA
ncbi:MAG: response regulator [Acidimicrobiales bacterium]